MKSNADYRRLPCAFPRLLWMLVLCVFPVVTIATNHVLRINEISAGLNGDANAQFVEIVSGGHGQKLWGPGGGTESRTMLAFFDSTGAETSRFKFPADPPKVGNNTVLVATAAFATRTGITPDIIMPPAIAVGAGKVCFKHNPAAVGEFFINLCVAYGGAGYTGDTEGAGPPSAVSLPVVGATSLSRTSNFSSGSDSNSNASFALRPITPAATATVGVTDDLERNFNGEQSTDSDNDGVFDIIDAFPFDPAETTDTDGDAIGDNADPDDDNDGNPDANDNCPLDVNSDQSDLDDDDIGDVCDPDTDGDGVDNIDDAFPFDQSETIDTDGDGIGDNTDADDDGDGVPDIDDAAPLDPTETVDTDGDGIGNNLDADDDNDGVIDLLDPFPLDPAESGDIDGDGIGDNADTDRDGDGLTNANDNCPRIANADQADVDADGIGDVCDDDLDNDGVVDEEDQFPLDPSESVDTDSDGIGNSADLDDDGDGVNDDVDALPLDPLEFEDSDGDGLGNIADPDDDNDGVPDVVDEFPFDPSESVDTDGDGQGNFADLDDDDDLVLDEFDNCSLSSNNDQADLDGDGLGDACDPDLDGDGVANELDGLPTDPTESVDTDGDGTGDNADPDDDGDAVPDNIDNCPEFSNANQSDADADGIGDACEFRATATIALGAVAFDLVIDAGRQRAYVSVPELDQVLVVSLRTNEVIDTIAVGEQPHGLAITQDATTLYVALRGSGALAVVDLDTLGVGQIDVSAGLENLLTFDVIEARPGRLVVTANPRSSGLSRLALVKTDEGNAVSRIGGSGFFRSDPRLETNAATKFLYVSEAAHFPNSLYQFDLSNDDAVRAKEDDHGSVSGTGNMALSPEGDHIAIGSGQILETFQTGAFNEVGHIAGGVPVFHPSGELLFTFNTAGTLEIFDASTFQRVEEMTIPCTITNIAAVALSTQGDVVFVLNGDEVCKFGIDVAAWLDTDRDGITNKFDTDDDADTVIDGTDNCPVTHNADQADLDGDGLGDSCDLDIDGDSRANGSDNCPYNPNLDQADFNNDGIGDACDADADGVADRDDAFPADPSETTDTDGDGTGDNGDADDDADTVNDDVDNCPVHSNAAQVDTDFDGLGDACDPVRGVTRFIEHHRDASNGVEGLNSAVGVAVSPDGLHVVVVGDLEMAVFVRTGSTGRLQFLQSLNEPFDSVRGLENSEGVAFSPDGDNVYVVSHRDDIVAVFGRDPGTGRLNFIESVTNGQLGTNGLDAPTSITVSPDGKHVYVTAFAGNTVVVFARDSVTGSLSFVQNLGADLVGGPGITGPQDLILSPDGKHVYVVALTDETVTVFARNQTTGRLVFVEQYRDDPDRPSSFDAACGIGISPDGNQVYVTAAVSDTLTVFGRNPTSGRLEQIERHKHADDGVGGLDGACRTTVSPDGEHVYVTSDFRSTLATFSRDPVSGGLRYVGHATDGENGVDGLRSAQGVVVSPDSHHVYVAAAVDDAVAVFARHDNDGDGVRNDVDALPNDASETLDTDGDGVGDNADTDDDGDGVADGSDNCPLDANAAQADLDGDGLGDPCDGDIDGDGVANAEDAFVHDPTEHADPDHDGIGSNTDDDDDNDGLADAADNCPSVVNVSQADFDGDGIGDVCDADRDGDRVPNETDAFPSDPGESADTDGDGLGNVADPDDDGDGVADPDDAFPLDPVETTDTDGDGIGDIADLDDDGDGRLDAFDDLPLDPAETADTDDDGIGDTVDGDDDGDGIADGDDNCPLDPNAGQLDQDFDGVGDACDPKTAASIELTGQPFDIALHPFRPLAYVSMPSFGEVHVLSTVTNELVEVIEIGFKPQGIDVSHDGRRLYAALNGSGEVAVLDLDNRTVETIDVSDGLKFQSVSGGLLTHDVIEVRPGRLAVTANPGSGGLSRVALVDTTAGNVVSAIADDRIIRASPTLATNLAGDVVYVGEGFSPNSLYKLDLSTDAGPIVKEDAHGSVSGTNRMAVSPDGSRIVIGSGQVLNTEGEGPLAETGRIAAGTPAYHPSGDLIYVAAAQSTLKVFEAQSLLEATDEITSTCDFNTVSKAVISGDGAVVFVLGGDRVCKVVVPGESLIDTDDDGLKNDVDSDDDGDSVADDVDNCPLIANPGQSDLDGDGFGDRCDRDADGDAVLNVLDNCPFAVNPDQEDVPGNGVGDACDIDGDGAADLDDAFPADPEETADTDLDGTGDNADTDDDGDGVPDVADNCPLHDNPAQTDIDFDGVGDACDPTRGTLTFVEAQRDGVSGVTGLDSASQIVVSPDGRHLYVAAPNDDAISIFTRDNDTGALSFIDAIFNFQSGKFAIDLPREMAMSPDGNYLYVASRNSRSISVFHRESMSGALTFVARHLLGDAPTDALISTDGRHIYALTNGGGSIGIFTRDPLLGTLGVPAMFGTGLHGNLAGSFSHDSKHLYITSESDDVLAVFLRDPVTGSLSHIETLADGSNAIDGMQDPCSHAVSPDGRNVYVATSTDDALVVFARDDTTGQLQFTEVHKDIADPLFALDRTCGVTVSPDGHDVLVTSLSEDAVSVFNRDVTDGTLQFIEARRDGVDGIDGLNSAFGVTVSPDGEHVYVAGAADDAVAVFARHDNDVDGVRNDVDAFPNDAAETLDTDGDGVGNNADPDDDGDGVTDGSDNCPLDANAGQADLDGDGLGDPCDGDIDGDGVANAEDAFVHDPTEHADPDSDGIGSNTDDDDDNDGLADAADNCPSVVNVSQADFDGDGIGDVCDPDLDGDGVPNEMDAFPSDPGESADTDGDGLGNVADPDDDGDGVVDPDDAFPLDASEFTDTDGDGIGDIADLDDDGDGRLDAFDDLPLDPGATTDTDDDGIGNPADEDDDGDGIADGDDNCPLNANAEQLDQDFDGVGDACDPKTAASIELTGQPFDIALHPFRPLAYVSMPSFGQIHVLSTVTNELVEVIEIGFKPQGIDVSHDGLRLYAALNATGEVAVLDLDNRTVETIDVSSGLAFPNLDAGLRAYDVIEARPGRLVVTANPGSGGLSHVALVNTAAGNTVSMIAGQRIIRASPTLASNLAGDVVYVSESFSPNSLYKLDLRTDAGPIVKEDAHGSVSGTTRKAVSPDGARIVIGSGQVLNTGGSGPFVETGRIAAGTPVYHPSGDLIYVAASQSTLKVFEAQSLLEATDEIASTCNFNLIRKAVISGDGNMLYVLGESNICKIPTLADTDHDAITTVNDNCPTRFNPGQTDANQDGIGDACIPQGIDARINEVMAGMNGDSSIQFVEIVANGQTHKAWGPHDRPVGDAMLTFFDANDRQVGRFVFPHDAPPGNDTVLIATRAFGDRTGITPDFVMPVLVMPTAGRVCLQHNPDGNGPFSNTCLSYGGGDFHGDVTQTGAPNGAMLSILNVQSLARFRNFTGIATNSSDFRAAIPTPASTRSAGNAVALEQNVIGEALLPAASSLAAQGETLFNAETFRGNGRTCASCHLPAENFRLPPHAVAALPDSDPLFVHESNINTLVVDSRASVFAAAPSAHTQPSDYAMGGMITGSLGGSAKIAGGSGNRYSIIGGIDLDIPDNVITDEHGNSGTLLAFIPGNLNGPAPNGDLRGLEVSHFLRGPRALIVENINGFDQGAFLRRSQHLENLRDTAPYGHSGEFADLQSFSANAVAQHFTRNLARVPGVDFRTPSNPELDALAAFMNTIETPADGATDAEALFDRFVTTQAQQRGRAAFFGEAKCSVCHSGRVLATSNGQFNTTLGMNEAFNTGVARRQINSVDGLPSEQDAGNFANTRAFSTPALFGIRHNGPYFHDHSAESLLDAVRSYGEFEFGSSPAAAQVGQIPAVSFPGIAEDIEAFLKGLTELPFSFTREIRFASQIVGNGAAAPLTLTVTNTSSADTLTINSISLVGEHTAEFSITPAAPNDGPFPVGDTRTLEIGFEPADFGMRTALLELDITQGTEVYSVGVALTGLGDTDFDGDGLGDAVDPDGDDDEIPNTVEIAHGLDPFDPADAVEDKDFDGVSNVEEFLLNRNISVDERTLVPIINSILMD